MHNEKAYKKFYISYHLLISKHCKKWRIKNSFVWLNGTFVDLMWCHKIIKAFNLGPRRPNDHNNRGVALQGKKKIFTTTCIKDRYMNRIMILILLRFNQKTSHFEESFRTYIGHSASLSNSTVKYWSRRHLMTSEKS